MVPTTGLFARILNWINSSQQEFYRALTGALKAMRQDGSKLWLLIGLSFAYGIFHAAGPGHGKAVISSYMVANEVALRRGIMLSFVSALLQALTAIVGDELVYFVLRGTAVSMTDATWFLGDRELCVGQRCSAPGCCGGSLRAPGPVAGRCTACRPPMPSAMMPIAATTIGICTDHPHGLRGVPCHDHRKAQPEAAHHAARWWSATLAAMRMRPTQADLGGEHFDWRTAWSAVAAVGLGPAPAR